MRETAGLFEELIGDRDEIAVGARFIAPAARFIRPWLAIVAI